MQATGQKQNQRIFFKEINIEILEAMNCIQIRESLDALFDENFSLEETPPAIKRSLFRHLETCRDCCRSFDVRLRFRSVGRGPIY